MDRNNWMWRTLKKYEKDERKQRSEEEEEMAIIDWFEKSF